MVFTFIFCIFEFKFLNPSKSYLFRKYLAKFQQVKIVAGHNPNETAGRLCLWSHDGADDEDADKFGSFIEYRRSLKLKCIETSKTATFHFTPTAETPDTLYYQVTFPQ